MAQAWHVGLFFRPAWPEKHGQSTVSCLPEAHEGAPLLEESEVAAVATESEREPPRGASRRDLHALAEAGAKRELSPPRFAPTRSSSDSHARRHSMPDLYGRRVDGVEEAC